MAAVTAEFRYCAYIPRLSVVVVAVLYIVTFQH